LPISNYLAYRSPVERIEVSTMAYARIQFAARVSGLSPLEVVDRLVVDAAGGDDVASREPRIGDGLGIRVSATYLGTTVEGSFDPRTNRLEITSPQPDGLAGTYRSPSQAAIALIKTVNPKRESPETNGWKFWHDELGRPLDSHRPEPRTTRRRSRERGAPDAPTEAHPSQEFGITMDRQTWKSALRHEIESSYAVGVDFTLSDLYRRSEKRLQELFPANSTVRDSLRKVLQQLRDEGLIAFIDDDGTYRRLR